LEEREEAFKKSKLDKQEGEAARNREEERIKEEGRKMREEKEQQSKQRAKQWTGVQEDEAMPPEIGVLFLLLFFYHADLSFRFFGHNRPSEIHTNSAPEFA
jgi:hypothetical protein